MNGIRGNAFGRMVSRTATGLALLAASNLALTGVARADVAGEMNSFFNDAGGAANVTGPSAYQGNRQATIRSAMSGPVSPRRACLPSICNYRAPERAAAA